MKGQTIAAAALSLLPLLIWKSTQAQAQAQAQPRASVAPPVMQKVAPDLARYTDDVLFGTVWERPGLAKRDRSLVTITTLIATGRTGPLQGHAGRALDNGVTPRQLSGLVTHLAFYCGWPSAVAALEPLDALFKARGIDTVTLKDARGLLPTPADDAQRAAAVKAALAGTAPALADLTNDVLFADLWRNPALSPRDRSLVTVAALAATGASDQLDFHLGLAQRNGLSRAELAEAITHLAFYAGWPKAMAAVGQLAKADGADDAPADPLIAFRPGQEPTRGPADRFTGVVTVTSPFKGNRGSQLAGATVRFEPGARSNWHSHASGQLLVVTQGEGRVQNDGGPVRILRPGDVVWTAPGVRHWHGAAPNAAMTHVALSEGGAVTWMEPVADVTYQGSPVE